MSLPTIEAVPAVSGSLVRMNGGCVSNFTRGLHGWLPRCAAAQRSAAVLAAAAGKLYAPRGRSFAVPPLLLPANAALFGELLLEWHTKVEPECTSSCRTRAPHAPLARALLTHRTVTAQGDRPRFPARKDASTMLHFV